MSPSTGTSPHTLTKGVLAHGDQARQVTRKPTTAPSHKVPQLQGPPRQTGPTRYTTRPATADTLSPSRPTGHGPRPCSPPRQPAPLSQYTGSRKRRFDGRKPRQHGSHSPAVPQARGRPASPATVPGPGLTDVKHISLAASHMKQPPVPSGTAAATLGAATGTTTNYDKQLIQKQWISQSRGYSQN